MAIVLYIRSEVALTPADRSLFVISSDISLNALFADNFPENVEDVFKENRIEVPISYMANQAENLYKLVKDMNDAFEYGNNTLLPQLESTIKLL